MNKYQEALDRFSPSDSREEEIKDTMQELIDNYSKISQFDRAIFFNSKGVCVNGITYEQLEKALDKACKDCEAFDEGLAYETSCDNFKVDSWEVRKKRYLEESEKQ